MASQRSACVCDLSFTVFRVCADTQAIDKYGLNVSSMFAW
jgi:hypothetical protein